MNSNNNLNLESAKYIRHPKNNYPAVELIIDGKKGYLIELDYNDLDAGIVGITDIFDKVDWSEILPVVHLPEETAAKYGIPSEIKGVTTDSRVLLIAKNFWRDTNTEGAFTVGTVKFPID